MNSFFGRRRFLKTLLAIPCALAGYFAYKRIKHGDGIPRTIGAPDLPPPGSLTWAEDGVGYSFFALGDTGADSANRAAVVDRLSKQASSQQTDAIFLLGDNFYEKGVASIDDPLWQRDFEQPFSADRFPCPFYVCLGNHDYYGNVAAQIEYGQIHDRWNLPNPYYSFTKKIGDDRFVEFFVLDTTPIEEGDYSARSQVLWLKQKLATSTADFKIAVGHHPLYTGGEHGPSRRNFRQLTSLFDHGGIDLYLSGHDHDLQLHDTKRGWLHLVSGAGSKLRSVRWTGTTQFAQATAGFARVIIDENRLGIEIYSDQKLLFSLQRSKARVRSG